MPGDDEVALKDLILCNSLCCCTQALCFSTPDQRGAAPPPPILRRAAGVKLCYSSTSRTQALYASFPDCLGCSGTSTICCCECDVCLKLPCTPLACGCCALKMVPCEVCLAGEKQIFCIGECARRASARGGARERTRRETHALAPPRARVAARSCALERPDRDTSPCRDCARF